MTDRITKENLRDRVVNVNRRMGSRGSAYRYLVEYRNGYTAIDRVRPNGAVVNTVRAGMTKSEAGEFLHAMMVALDDAGVCADTGATAPAG